MMKLLFATAVSLSLVGVAHAGEACSLKQAQAAGLAGFLPQTDIPACAVYGENHGGWLTALLFGKPSGVQQAQGLPAGVQAANFTQ